MQIIGCGKGHYYNPELYSSCPECAKEGGNADVLGVTEPVNFNKYANRGGNMTENVSATDWNIPDVGATEAVKKNDGPSSFLETDFFDDPVGKTIPGSKGGSSKVETYGKTEAVSVYNKPDTVSSDPIRPDATKPHAPFQPVVGWLVCIDGPAKGRDFRIHSQYNYIGRGQHMDICISGDNCISTDRAAVIAYDALEKFFSFGPSMGHNVVRVNGKMLMNAVVLNPYDELTIGQTKLLFVPLCGERFDWNGK